MAKYEQGFSTVELIFTLLIAALFLTIFYQVFILTDRIAGDSRDLNRVNQVAYRKLQEYENREFTAITTPGGATPTEVADFASELPSDIPKPATAKIFTALIAPQLKAVNVKATYGSGPTQRIVEYTTYIQESGLGR